MYHIINTQTNSILFSSLKNLSYKKHNTFIWFSGACKVNLRKTRSSNSLVNSSGWIRRQLSLGEVVSGLDLFDEIWKMIFSGKKNFIFSYIQSNPQDGSQLVAMKGVKRLWLSLFFSNRNKYISYSDRKLVLIKLIK